MAYHTVFDLGAKQKLTPEGFLICEDVPIARTGSMHYLAGEIPSLEAAGGIIRIDRDEAVVFDPRTLASFEGKPVTDDHPDDDVTPENWKQLAVGVTQNVRRGVGMDRDFLMADLVITHAETIKAVRDGKREVSCGYDANYEQIEPGRGRPTSIIGNHVALVSRGRCGSRCSIQDKDGVTNMTKLKDKILAAFTLGDRAALNKTLDELPDTEGQSSAAAAGGVHLHLSTPQPEAKTKDTGTLDAEAIKALIADGVAAAMKAAKTKDGEEGEEDEGSTKDGEGDEEDDDKTYDSAAAFKDLVSRAEQIVPGFEVKALTTDAAKDKKKARDSICACKRRVLDAAMGSESGRKIVGPLLNGKSASALTKDGLDAAFIAASEMAAMANNVKTTPSGKTHDANTIDAHTRGGMDAIHNDFWKPQNKA